MRIVTLNIQGVKNKVNHLLQDWHDVDAIALIETWHSEDSVPTFRGCSVEKVIQKVVGNMRQYGGILVLIKQGSLCYHLRIPSKLENIVWAKIPLTNGKSLMLGIFVRHLEVAKTVKVRLIV